MQLELGRLTDGNSPSAAARELFIFRPGERGVLRRSFPRTTQLPLSGGYVEQRFQRKLQRDNGGSPMSKRVADVLVETLQVARVKTCYEVVGDTLKQIAHSIDRSGIDWVHNVRAVHLWALAQPSLRLSVFVQWM
jgi:hypothetical protein